MQKQQELLHAINKEGFPTLTAWAESNGYNAVTAFSARRRYFNNVHKRHIKRNGKQSKTNEIIAKLCALVEKHKQAFEGFKHAA